MGAATEIDTIEGIIEGALWFHYDVSNDVLYLRLNSMRHERVYGEETPEGFTLLKTEDDRSAGMTIVHYWQRFGIGDIRQISLQNLQHSVEAWALQHVPAA
jgi:hypothetical protein